MFEKWGPVKYPHFPKMSSLCTVYVLTLYSLCPHSVRSMSSLCTVYVLTLYGLCPHSVRSMSSLCIVYVLTLYGLCPHSVRSMSSLCTVYVLTLYGLCLKCSTQRYKYRNTHWVAVLDFHSLDHAHYSRVMVHAIKCRPHSQHVCKLN